MFTVQSDCMRCANRRVPILPFSVWFVRFSIVSSNKTDYKVGGSEEIIYQKHCCISLARSFVVLKTISAESAEKSLYELT